MRAFVFPGQGSGVEELEENRLSEIRGVIGERVPDQVKLFSRAAEYADHSRDLRVRPDIVAGHSLGEYGAAYAATSRVRRLDAGHWAVRSHAGDVADLVIEHAGLRDRRADITTIRRR